MLLSTVTTTFELPSSQVVQIVAHDLDGTCYTNDDQDRHDRMYVALLSLTTHSHRIVLNCSFDALDHSYHVRGFVVACPTSTYAEELTMLEHQVLVLARTMEQAHIWKWTSHVWGGDCAEHSNVIQEIVPTFAQLQGLRVMLPCYDISSPPTSRHEQDELV
ncbi:hypothetical protein H257_00085 [Aphanomyces astaci]|uniref:Uncharacterized protein n=1 Tax=Aphanomyces astaci TaxID=112090 RepID=W4H992_APHAT|nr:hypothetical protein H257_00085 [Aphanomyces astaci]ETV88507.1 hypothetical protein H257_00085 [Aphanomyces astaci]|eukprot:XP_009820907.1 hypothetical protein H257_00085 [Aphanomyces astaci]